MFAVSFPGEWVLKFTIEHPDAAFAVGSAFIAVLIAVGGLLAALARAWSKRTLDGSGVDVALRTVLQLLPDFWGAIKSARGMKATSAPLVEPVPETPEAAARLAYEASGGSSWDTAAAEVKAHFRKLTSKSAKDTTRHVP